MIMALRFSEQRFNITAINEIRGEIIIVLNMAISQISCSIRKILM